MKLIFRQFVTTTLFSHHPHCFQGCIRVKEADGTIPIIAILIRIPTTTTLRLFLLLYSNIIIIMIMEFLRTLLTPTLLLDPRLLLFSNIMDLQTTNELLQNNVQEWRQIRQRQLVSVPLINSSNMPSNITSKIIIMHRQHSAILEQISPILLLLSLRPLPVVNLTPVILLQLMHGLLLPARHHRHMLPSNPTTAAAPTPVNNPYQPRRPQTTVVQQHRLFSPGAARAALGSSFGQPNALMQPGYLTGGPPPPPPTILSAPGLAPP